MRLLPLSIVVAAALLAPPSLAQCDQCGCDALDYFESDLAIEGEVILVGAYADELSTIPGSAYVFEFNLLAGEWLRTAALEANDASPGDGFGISLDLDGGVALVGAYHASSDVGHNDDSGAAYVIEKTGNSWAQTAKLVPAQAADYDMIGYAVSISGDRALLGAPGRADLGPHSGAAYVFERAGPTAPWAEVAKLVAPDGAPNDLFGAAVALDGDRALVGAFGDDDAGSRSGSVYVFERTTTWTNTDKLTAGDAASDDFFGIAVSLTGGTALVGAPGDDDAGPDTGSAYVFELSGSWSETAKLLAVDAAAGDDFGTDVDVLGDRVVVSAPGHHGEIGALFVFEREQAGWFETQKRMTSDGLPGEQLGLRVDQSATTMIAGSDRLACSTHLFPISTGRATWWVDAAGNAPGTGSPTDPYTSVDYALAQASTRAGDRVLVAPGTYVDEIVDFRGKDVVVRSLAGPASTVLVAPDVSPNTTPVVRFVNGEGADAVLEGFTITGGTGEQRALNFGGGVYIEGASPTIRDCVMSANAGDNGGALFSIFSEVTLIDCVVEDNGLAAPCGGGLFFHTSDATVIDTVVRGNGGTLTARGGGVYTEFADVTYIGSTFADNRGAWGGGVFCFDGAARFEACTIVDNATSTRGGGVYSDVAVIELVDTLVSGNTCGTDNGGGAFLDDCTTSIERTEFAGNQVGEDHWGGGLYTKGGTTVARQSTFRDNFAGHGGGVHVETGVASFVACDFEANTARSFGFLDGSGGGLANDSATVDALFCTFYANRAIGITSFGGRGGGVHGDVELRRCTFTGNEGDGGGSGVWGATLSSSIVWQDSLGGNATAIYTDVEGGWPGVGNIDSDPLFWSGLAGDLHLLPGSPCIDAGNPNEPLDGDGSIADMGARTFDVGHCMIPATYCQAKTSSQGCVPQIGSTGTPTLTGPDDLHVVASKVPKQEFGMLIWGGTPAETPFGGGFLCVGAPILRTPVQDSGGTGDDCSGTFDFHFSQQLMASSLLVPFSSIHAQYWFRDPGFAAPNNVGLSAGLHIVLCP